MSETEEKLAELDKEYENAPMPEKGNFDPLPDGKYQINVEEVFFETSQSGNLMLKWKFRVISGQFAKRMIFKNSMLQTPKNMEFLKGDLDTCGITLGKLRELQSRLEELLDVKLEVTLKNKKDGDASYTNVYFNSKLIYASDIPDEKGSNGDLPF